MMLPRPYTLSLMPLLMVLSIPLVGQDCNANFTTSTPGGCNVVSFTPATNDNDISFQWNFGDGETSTERAPDHTYFVDAPGNYNFNVTLIVSGNCVPDTVSQNVSVSVGSLPDPSIESVNVSDFINCFATNDNPAFDLEINNNSSTAGSNTSYTIDWGDGSAPETVTNLPNGTMHRYNQVGLFNLALIVRGNNGCEARRIYEVYNGNNPGGNVSSTSNTIACIPETVGFPIRDTENNVSGTIYRLWVNDGLSDTIVYQHPPPGVFTYEFLSSACDSNYTDLNGRFTISFEAQNPCFTQPGATTVIVNRPPVGDFTIDDDVQCAESVFTFTNTSTPGNYFQQNAGCSGEMRTNWSISPNSGYELQTGDLESEEGFSARFDEPGTYNITMIYQSRFSSGCDPDTVIKTICVLPIPESSFNVNRMSGCATFTIETTNTSNTLNSCREGTDYTWIMRYDPGECAVGPAFEYVNMTNENDINVEIQFDSAGIYELGLIVSNECLPPDTSFQTIVVSSRPITTLAMIPDTCFTGPITIEPSVTSTTGCSEDPNYSWNFPGANQTSGSGANPGPVTYDEPGVYTITVNTSNDCGNRSTSRTFEIFAPPTIPNITFNSPICIGTTARFINPNPGNFMYSWTGPAGFTSSVPAPEIADVTTAQSGTYELIITDPQTGCTNTRSFPLQVTTTAPLTVTPNPANICVGESVVLTVSGPSTVTWRPGDHLSSTMGTSVTVSPPTVGTYEYIVEGTDPNESCNGLDTVVVIVNPLPVVEAGERQVACVDTDFQLTGSPANGEGGTGTWGGPNVAANGTFNSSDAGVFTVGYRFVDDNGCEAVDSTQVCVIPDPVASFSLDNTTGCLNLQVAASNTSNTIGGCEAAVYEWSASLLDAECHENDGGVQFVEGTNATSENAVFRFPQSGIYEISLMVMNDCNTVTSTQQVTVGETPQVSLDPIGDACGNANITPTFTALNCNSTITTYEWEFVGGNPSTFSGMNPPAVSYATPDCYTVKLTVTNDCGSDVDLIEFCVLEGPTLDADLSADFVCQDGTINAINNSQGDNLTYQWSASSTQIGISAETAAAPTFSFTDVPQGDYQITLEVANAACAGLTEQFDIRVIEDPSVAMNPIEDFCESARITPSATFSDEDFIDSVRWTFPPEADIQTSDQLSPGVVNINEAGDYTFSVTVYNACNEQTSSQSFRVLEGPNLDISLDTTFVCVGAGTISVMNNSSGDDLAYTWTESSGGQIQISDESAASPTFSFANTPIGDYQITVSVANPVCDGLTQTFDIRVSETPTVTLAAIDNFCETARIQPVPTYSDENFIDSVRWIFPAEANVQTSDALDPGEIEINQPGDYTIQVTVYNACGPNRAEQAFRILEGPNLDIALDTAFVCAGAGTISVMNNSSGDDLAYTWTESSGGQIQISDENAASPTFSFTNTPIGDYQITVTVANPVCDGLTQTFDIRVSETPTVTLGTIEDFCETARIQPSPSYSDEDFIDSVRWTFPVEANVQTSTALDPGEVAIDQPGDYTFSVTVYNACGQNNAQQSFRVLEGPNLDISLDTAFVCSGSGMINVINNSTGDDLAYTWEESSGGQIQISDANAARPVFSFANTPIGDYQLTVTVGNPVCDGLTQTFDIRVSETPSVTLAAIEDFCETARILPIPTYSNEDFIDSVRWTFPMEANVQTSTTLDPGEIAIDQPGDYTFSVTVYNACGEDMTTQSFRILEGPNLDIALDTAFVCSGSGTIMVINNSTGDDLSYAWEESSNGQIQISDATSATPTFSFANTPIGNYQLTVTVANPVCDGLTQTFDIRVSETPSVTLAAIEDFCETARILPIPTYSNEDFIDSVRWTFPVEANVQTSTALDPGEIAIDQPGNYTFSVTVYNACGTDTAEQAFRILEGPNLDIQLDTAFVCAGSGSIMVINNSTGDDLSYTWEESSNGQIQISDATSATPTFSFVNTPIGDYQLTVTVTNPVCDGLTQTFDIRVSETPSVTLAAIEDFCETASIVPVPTYSDQGFIDSVRWIFPAEADIQTSTDFNPGQITINQPGNYTFALTVYNACGQDTASQAFRILEGPNLDIALDTSFVCAGSGMINVINNSTGDDLSYTWVESSGGQIQISDENAETPTFSFVNTPIGDYQLTVTVTNPVCDGLTQTFNIRVSETPSVTLEAIEDFCETALIQPIVTYSNEDFIDSVRWTFPAEAATQTSVALDPGEIAINQPGDYTFSVTVYNACGADTAEQSFRILEGPNLDISLDTTFACTGVDRIEVINNSTGDDLSYAWEESSGGLIQISDATIADPVFSFENTPIGDYQLTVTVSNPVCEALTQSFNIRISDSPEVAFEAIEDFCETAAFQVVPTYSDTSFIDSVRWVFPAEADVTSSTALFPGIVNIDESGSYSVVVTVYNECGQFSAERTFQIFEGPSLAITLDSTFACRGDVITISNNSTGDSLSYQWRATGPGQVEISDPTATAPALTFPDTGIYIIEAEISNPVCEPIFWQDTVLVSELPVTNLAAISDYCGEALIRPNPTYGDANRIDSVRWLFPGGSPLSSTDLFPDEVFYDTAGIYTVTLLAYNRCGVDSSSQSFAVLAPIEVDAVLSSDFSCELPHNISVENLTKGDSLNFEWSVSGPFAQNVEFDPQLVEPTFVFQDTGQYIITQRVFNEICGELSWQDTVTILTVPQPSLTGVDRFCEEVTLTPTINYFEYRLDSVRWDFPGGSPATSADLNPTDILYVGAGTYVYSLTAYNECGNTVVRDTFIVDTIPVIDLGPADTICITDGPFQLPNASPPGGIWLDSLRRPGVVTEDGRFDPVLAMGGPTTVEYLYTVGVCEISTYKTVLVIDLSFVDGGPDVDACVSDSLILLSGGSPAGGWYEGPGVTDSIGFFSPAALGEGCYTLTYFYQLEGTDCVQGDDFTVCVRPLPVPEISVTDSICVNVPVPLFSVGSGEVAYEWLINDSLLYTTANPSHAFSDTGFQTVKLISISEFGCRDSILREVYVSGPPIAFFELDTLMGCAVLPVNATNLSLGYEFVTYTWDFGDDTQSNEEQPGTVFYDQGLQDTTYYISLLAQNHCGQSIHEDSVIVFPKPIARIDLSQERGCTPLDVEFNNFSQGLPDSFIWDLGIPGGIYTDSIPPDQSYLAPDSNNVFYNIQFIAINECGQDTVSRVIEVLPDDIRAFFSVDQQVGCEPFDVEFFNSTAPDTLINYDWFFGDGETDNVKNPMHTFFPRGDSSTTYTSVLIADNGCGRDSIAIPITVHPAPEVSFTVPPVNCARDSVPFTNTSLDVTGSIWSFGDGDTLLATSPTHFYQGEGTYQVDLTAFAVGTGCPNTYTDFVEIRPIPTASLSASPVFGCPPLQVNVSNTSSDANYFIWDYGDGNTDVGNPTQHTYTESGFYDIRLTATDDFGCSDDTVFSTIQVYPVPDVAFESFADQACGTPVEICLENMTVGAQGFDWDFGNGMTSTENSPCIIYDQVGTYPVQLTAQNEFLCTETLIDTVIVYGIPEASFELPPPPFCQGTQIVLDNTSSFADYAEWTLTDGFFSTEWSPTITLEELGDLGIQLIVGNGSGCTDTTENQVEVFPTPTALFTFVELAVQIPDVLPTSIQFIDKSSADAILFDWDFGDGNTSEEENPVHRYLSSYDKLVTHWVANMYGCTDTATALVDLDTLGGLYIPNALEPDAPSGSGKNTFLPRGIGLSEFHIAVYARTGQLIWESTSLDDEGMPDEGWDGTFRGRDLPPDTYTWKVHLAKYLDGSYWQGAPDRRGKLRKSGFVYLIK